ncbi:hypothetical protein SAY87_023604 [Trapa incisa]|uniref:Uncharacterized protein n=1 Tax=Trapa incisa TaxID=236973 RepID=A0AAN7L3R6_9MYRT|nr:hypothetical protein SAY87_023604 [Trapa incisa]
MLLFNRWLVRFALESKMDLIGDGTRGVRNPMEEPNDELLDRGASVWALKGGSKISIGVIWVLKSLGCGFG